MPPARVDAAHFSPDTRAFIEVLHERGVRYLIVGGEAVIFHGRARLTGDVDFFFASDPENAGRLFAALRAFWEGDVPGVEDASELMPEGLILQFGLPPNRIDLINEIDGVSFAEAWEGRVVAVMLGEHGEIPIPYIGIAELARNKRAAGRPKDLDDLEYLTR
jgi:hypothetical protein